MCVERIYFHANVCRLIARGGLRSTLSDSTFRAVCRIVAARVVVGVILVPVSVRQKEGKHGVQDLPSGPSNGLQIERFQSCFGEEHVSAGNGAYYGKIKPAQKLHE